MHYTILILMFSALVAMFILTKGHDVKPKKKVAAFFFLVIFLVCGGFLIYITFFANQNKIIESKLPYIKAKTYIFARELTEQMPAAKVLVIVDRSNPENPDLHRSLSMEGLKEGFKLGTMDIKYDTPEVTIPEMISNENPNISVVDFMTAKDFNKLIDKHKECNLIISMVGLPQDAGEVKLWKGYRNDPKNTPKLALISDNASRLAPLIFDGFLPVVVTNKPDPDFKAPPSQDLKECFDQRFLLITKKTMKDIAQKYPAFFK